MSLLADGKDQAQRSVLLRKGGRITRGWGGETGESWQEAVHSSQESQVAGPCSALTPCLGRTHCFNSSVLSSWATTGRTNEKKCTMISKGNVRQEGEQRGEAISRSH